RGEPEPDHPDLSGQRERKSRQAGSEPEDGLEQKQHESALGAAGTGLHARSIAFTTSGSRSTAKGPPLGLSTIQMCSIGGALMSIAPNGHTPKGVIRLNSKPSGVTQMFSCWCHAVSGPPGSGPNSLSFGIWNIAPSSTGPCLVFA